MGPVSSRFEQKGKEHMGTDEPRTDGSNFPADSARHGAKSSRLSRRQALGTMSVAATAGAAAWAVPEILTAKPAAAAMSGGGGGDGDGNGGGDGDGNGGGKGHKGPKGSAPLAVVEPGTVFPIFGRGRDVAHSVEVGGAMVAGGWAFHRWQNRKAEGGAASIGEERTVGDIGDPA